MLHDEVCYPADTAQSHQGNEEIGPGSEQYILVACVTVKSRLGKDKPVEEDLSGNSLYTAHT